MFRACSGCLATDRWLNRIRTKPKGREEADDEEQRRANGTKFKEDLTKETPEDKKLSILNRRSGELPKTSRKEDLFGGRKCRIKMRRVIPEERSDQFRPIQEVGPAGDDFEGLLHNPCGVGQTRGRPLDALNRSPGRNGSSSGELKAAMRQRMDISEQKDLRKYMEEPESRIQRARSRLQVEMTANSENACEEPQSVIRRPVMPNCSCMRWP